MNKEYEGTHYEEVQSADYCRVFSVSDIHTDHKENVEVIKLWEQLDFSRTSGTMCIDISHSRRAACCW